MITERLVINLNENQVIEILTQSLYTVIKVSAPMLIASLVIGLILSILQTITSIQEQTLTFVPKLLGVFLSIMLFGLWIMRTIVEFTEYLFTNFSTFING